MENNKELKSELKKLIIYHKDAIGNYLLHDKHLSFTSYQDVDRMKRFNKQINLLFKAIKADQYKPLESSEYYKTLLEVLIYFKSKISLKAKLEDLNGVHDSFVNSIDEILKMMEAN